MSYSSQQKINKRLYRDDTIDNGDPTSLESRCKGITIGFNLAKKVLRVSLQRYGYLLYIINITKHCHYVGHGQRPNNRSS